MSARKVAGGRLLCFWDYDTQWGSDADRARGCRSATGLGHLEFEATERLLDIHAEYRVPACFAVVGAAALPGERPYHDPAQIRRLHAAGHEIASHAQRHEWLPGLSPGALDDTVRLSKHALEQCIGAPVTTFVPPYNQPFDYPAAGSFSMSERRAVRRARIGLERLCMALAATGYRFCRVGYRPLDLRLLDCLRGGRVDRPARLERIAGVMCVRLNTPGGFAAEALAILRACARHGGIAVVYGHPHSIASGNSQDESYLRPFLAEVNRLRGDHGLQVVLPRELRAEERRCDSA